MAQLSSTMQAAIDYAKEHGGKITRYPGGYWAREGWIGSHEHSFGTTTIDALVTRGIAEYTRWQDRKRGGSRFPVEITLAETPKEK